MDLDHLIDRDAGQLENNYGHIVANGNSRVIDGNVYIGEPDKLQTDRERQGSVHHVEYVKHSEAYQS